MGTMYIADPVESRGERSVPSGGGVRCKYVCMCMCVNIQGDLFTPPYRPVGTYWRRYQPSTQGL